MAVVLHDTGGFDRLVPRILVERKVLEVLTGPDDQPINHGGYLHPFLGAVERAMGINPDDPDQRTPRPRYRSTVNQLPDLEHADLPHLVVVAAGYTNPRHHRGAWTVDFPIGVAALVEGSDWDDTREAASVYETAIIACLMRRRDLGDLGSISSYVRSATDEIDEIRTRTLSLVTAYFTVEVPAMVVDGLDDLELGDPDDPPPVSTAPTPMTAGRVQITRAPRD